jgi:hypothetical protein
MPSDAPNREFIRAPRRCGSHTLGHDVHFIQARLSLRDGVGPQQTVQDVAADGTITLADGSSVWHHDPIRLNAALTLVGNQARLGTHGVLRVACGEGSSYCFSVSPAPDPCRSETSEYRPGESLIEELLRRGGLYRSGPDVLRDIEGQEPQGDDVPDRRPSVPD